jgi:hypothetical protein
MVRGNLGRGLVPSPAWFKPLRPAAHAWCADAETKGRLFGATDPPALWSPILSDKNLLSIPCVQHSHFILL